MSYVFSNCFTYVCHLFPAIRINMYLEIVYNSISRLRLNSVISIELQIGTYSLVSHLTNLNNCELLACDVKFHKISFVSRLTVICPGFVLKISILPKYSEYFWNIFAQPYNRRWGNVHHVQYSKSLAIFKYSNGTTQYMHRNYTKTHCVCACVWIQFRKSSSSECNANVFRVCLAFYLLF